MKRVLAPILACALIGTAKAAEISSFKLDDEVTAIVVVGEIEPTDGRKFREEAGKHDQAVVFLESEGGSLGAALEIGEAIRLKGFTTAVINDSTCYSACGLIWLAGTPRALSKSGRVGFHAAYAESLGRQTESGVANAMVGRYLTLLNLPERAIIFATTAPPTDLSWLTSTNYRSTGIDVSIIDNINLKQQSSSRARASASRGPNTRLWRDLGSWSVYVDQTLNDGCFLAAGFTNDTLFRVGFDGTRAGRYYVVLGNPAWRSLKEGKEYNLRFQFDEETPWDVPVTAVDMNGSILLMSTFSDELFWVEFAGAQRLDVSRNDKPVTAISMAGTTAALDELLTCQKANLKERKSPTRG